MITPLMVGEVAGQMVRVLLESGPIIVIGSQSDGGISDLELFGEIGEMLWFRR